VDGSTVSARFIPAKLSDNTALLATDPDYQNRLRALGGDLAKALLEGDWNVFEGQFFKEWRAEKHVIDPFPIPQHWPKWTGTDDGVARPFVTLWLAQDPLTYRVYIYRELSIRGIGAASQRAQLFHDHCGGGEVYARHMADPSRWNREKDTGMCVADIFRQEGIRLEAADNDRYSGWQIWHEFLRDGDDGIPNLQVFSTCRQLIRNLPSLVHDDIKVEDLDTDGPDDEADAGRYALTAAKRIVPVVIESSRMAVTNAAPARQKERQWWQEPARGRR
jgi:phage terminase large subunit